MVYEMPASACILDAQAYILRTGCVKCHGHMLHDRIFLKTTFADFLDEVWVKIMQILSAIGSILLQQHLLFLTATLE